MDKQRRRKFYYLGRNKKSAIENEIAKINSNNISESDTELADLADELESESPMEFDQRDIQNEPFEDNESPMEIDQPAVQNEPFEDNESPMEIDQPAVQNEPFEPQAGPSNEQLNTGKNI